MSLNEMHRIRQWHLVNRAGHPLEYHLWDAVMTLWVMGWIGWLPAYIFGASWAYPLCALTVLLPRLYVGLRARAHQSRRMRCDWLGG